VTTGKCVDCNRRFTPGPGTRCRCGECRELALLLVEIHREEAVDRPEAEEVAARAAIHRGRTAGLRFREGRR
jgi:hypothetical protein